MNKICLVGNGGSGKTALINSLTGRRFEPRYIPTCGGQTRTLSQEGRTSLLLQDTPGQEISLPDVEAGVFLICFAHYSKLERRSIPRWVRLVRDLREDPEIMLVATKTDIGNCDLEAIQRTYDYPVVGVSSKKNTGIEELLNMVA